MTELRQVFQDTDTKDCKKKENVCSEEPIGSKTTHKSDYSKSYRYSGSTVSSESSIMASNLADDRKVSSSSSNLSHDDAEFTLKVVLTGDSGVGKSNLVMRFT